MTEDSNNNVLEWTPLNPESLVAAPCLIEQTLCCPTSSNPFQLAKDVNYARAVLDAWREDDADATWSTEWTSVTYSHNDKGTTTPLYGHLVRHCTPTDFPGTATTTIDDDGANRSDSAAIGILICHTGAGPHDLFLLWKAASLVQELSTDLAQRQRVVVVVLI